ncbi:uncharacterized protein LOC112692691 isoform X2 [Sipha flava]|uniref:Uncharacterized protein LOC112692691 isoform X2 n=1 Tax=Sipha flava TaxID=143950 RepID=A0A8B8GJK7_9HEMI|nr:uncharacterized protein LOC112692691 isoform X2 [Sipha flava]
MMSSTKSGEQRENETKLWCVVWFTESKEYSVIPTNWLVENKDSQSDSLFCKWPPYKVTSDHLKKAISPSQSWETYRVKFVGVNKTYGNFVHDHVDSIVRLGLNK